jgi:hypothetical protein
LETTAHEVFPYSSSRKIRLNRKNSRFSTSETVPRTAASYRSVAATRSSTNLQSVPVAEDLTHRCTEEPDTSFLGAMGANGTR